MVKKYETKLWKNPKIREELEINDGGSIKATFYGIDRSIVYDLTERDDGWFIGDGVAFPPITSDRWIEVV